MKKKLPILMAIALLGLAACSPASGESSSSITSSEEPSSSSHPSSSDISSSEEESSSSSIVEKGWNEEALAVFNKAFGEEHPIPYFDFESMGLAYAVEEVVTTDGSYVEITVPDFAVSDTSKVIESWTTGGIYRDHTAKYDVYEGEYVLDGLYEDYHEIQADMAVIDEENYILVEGNGILSITLIASSSPVTEWPGVALSEAIEENLGKSISMPEPTSRAAAYSLTLVADNYGYYPSLKMYGLEDVSSYANQLIESGYTEIPDVSSLYRLLIDPTDAISVYYIPDTEEGSVTLQIDVNTYYETSWPSEDITRYIYVLTNVNELVLPAPSFDERVIYYYATYNSSYGEASVSMYGGNFMNEYVSQLTSAGYKAASYSSGHYWYMDPTRNFLVEVEYDEENSCTKAYLIDADESYIDSWPSEAIAAAIERMTGATYIPVPGPEGISVDFYRAWDLVDSYGTYEILLTTVEGRGTIADLSERYIRLLTNEGYTYEESLSGYVDSSNTILITLTYNASRGLFIDIEMASPVYASWPSEAISSFLTRYEYSETIPAFSGGTSYSVSSDDATYSFWCVATEVTVEEVNAYAASLLEAGYTHHVHEYGGIDLYSVTSDALSMYIRLRYDEASSTLTIIAGPLSDYLFDETEFGNIQYTFAYYDYNIVIPDLTLPEGTFGTIDSSLAYYAIFTITIYDADVANSYAASLEATSGWTKEETPLEGYDASYSFVGEYLDVKIALKSDLEQDYTIIYFYY